MFAGGSGIVQQHADQLAAHREDLHAHRAGVAQAEGDARVRVERVRVDRVDGGTGQGHLAHAAGPALEDRLHPLGMVDERVAVVLVGVDDVVAVPLAVAHGVLLVPLQQRRQDAHVGDRRIPTGHLDQGGVVGQDQVGLGAIALEADVEVEQRARDIAPAADPGLPGDIAVAVVRARLAVVGRRRVRLRDVRHVVVGIVVARRVVARIAEHQGMAVGVGQVRGAIVREAVAVGPRVLAVVGPGAAADLHVGRVLVHVDDVGGVQRILVGQVEHVPGVGGRGRIRDLDVAGPDDGMHRGAQRGAGRGVDAVVIAGRRVGQGRRGQAR